MTAEQVPDQATLGTPAHESVLMAGPWTEDEMLKTLWAHFATQGWAPIPQVTVAGRDIDTAMDHLSAVGRYAESVDRRIDLLLARPAKRKGLSGIETLSIEVKVTRADFRNDIRHPEKQAPWRRATHRHAYAVPAGLIARDEVPEGSGLLVVKRGRGAWNAAEWVIRAPYRPDHAPQLPNRVWIALSHRLSRLEAATRGWDHRPAAAGTEQDLRAALAAAHKGLERSERAAEREKGKAEAWRAAHALAVGAGHPCRWCGEPLKPLNPDKGWFKRWRHVNGDHDAPCADAETQMAENEAVDAWEAATEAEAAEAVRSAHQWGFSDLVDAEPWRAFLTTDWKVRGRHKPVGPVPLDVLPDGGTP